jgi:hypothetical protein
MIPEILFIPKHVRYGMETCGVNFDDLAEAIDNENFEKTRVLFKNMSKIDVKDLITTDGIYKKYMFNVDVVKTIAGENKEVVIDKDITAILESIDVVENSKNEKIKDLYNILSSDKTTGNISLETISKWLTFTRVNNVIFVFVENDFTEFFLKDKVAGMTLFYRYFIDMLYKHYGDEAFTFYYFYNFLKFLLKNQRN